MRVFITGVITTAGIKRHSIIEAILVVYMMQWGIGMYWNFLKKRREDYLYHVLENTVENEEIEELQMMLTETAYGNFGGPVWWQWLRLVHSSCILLYVNLTVYRWKYAFLFSWIDTITAIVAGLVYYNR